MALTLGNIGEEMNLLIRQGATFGPFPGSLKNPDGSPVDLTGKTLAGSIRKTPASATSYPVSFTIIDPLLGTFEVVISEEITTTIPTGPALNHPDSKYVWDAEMSDAGGVIPLYWGTVSVFREVTRA